MQIYGGVFHVRRKLFALLIAAMAVIFLFDEIIGLDRIYVPGSLNFIGSEHEFIGEVVSVKEKSKEKFYIEVEIPELKNEKILLKYYSPIEQPWQLYRANIRFKGILRLPDSARNPKCFDYRKYLKSQEIWTVCTLKEYEILPASYSLIDRYQRFLFRSKCRFLDSLDENLKPFLNAVLFGETAGLDEDVYDDFRNNGTAHILAVSGLHIGILYSLLRKLTGEKITLMSFAFMLLFFLSYGSLAMWSPSVTRAIVMIFMSIAARLYDMRYDILTSMSFIALILILKNPYVIYGTGFQMSFLAITSIGFFGNIIPKKIPKVLRSSIAVSLGLTIYQIYVFNYVSLVSIFVNIPIIFLSGCFVPVGIFAFILSVFGLKFGFIEAILSKLANLIIAINELSTFNGKSSLDIAVNHPFILAFLFLTVFFLASDSFLIMKLRGQWSKVKKCFVLIICTSLFFFISTYSPITNCDVIFVDVGQGDCCHINAGRIDVLIDGGGNVNYNVGKNTLKPYLLKNGNSDIDLAIATHTHTDHFKGLEELNECFEIKEIKSGLTQGAYLSISRDVKIECVWPLEIKNYQDGNENCSVFKITYGNMTFLVTGDLDQTGEKAMVRYYSGTDKLKCDVLKIGHHGSKTATSDEFLQAVQPKIAVIQVGKNNYGHPAPETLDKLKNAGVSVLRNDQSGALGFKVKLHKYYCQYHD